MKKYILSGLLLFLSCIILAQPQNAIIYAGYSGLIGNKYTAQTIYIGTDVSLFKIAIRVNGDSVCRLKKVYANNMHNAPEAGLTFTKEFSFSDVLYKRDFASAVFNISTVGLTPNSTMLTFEFDNADIRPLFVKIKWTDKFSMGGEIAFDPSGNVSVLYPTDYAYLGSPNPAVTVPYKILDMQVEGRLKGDSAWRTRIGDLASNPKTVYYRLKVSRTDGVYYSNMLIRKGGDSVVCDRSRPYVLENTYLSTDPADYVQDITYKDRFHRPVQEIAIESSPLAKDLIQVYRYGPMGSQERSFLPFLGSGDKSGSFVNEYTSSSNWSAYGSEDQGYAFSLTEYDNSPLNRAVKQTAPGADWHTAGKGVGTIYRFNDAGEVILWRFGAEEFPLKAGTYEANTLNCVRTTDEDGHVAEVYTDRSGRMLLSVRINGSDRLSVYYIYDDFGRLRYVLPPEVSAASSLTADILGKYAYSYRYDRRGRQIETCLPGCGPVYYVYDRKDRLVLSQDGNQRIGNRWNYVLYDTRNRPVEKGEVSLSGRTHAQLQAEAGGSENYVPSPSREAYQYQCYDTYANTPLFTHHPFVPEVGFAVDSCRLTAGLPTGIKTRIVGTATWLTATIYYDSQGRESLRVSDNQYGRISRVSYAYDFVGNVLKVRESHMNSSGGTDVVATVNSYDNRSRLLSTSVILNNETAQVNYSYDELGRLAGKTYGTGTPAVTEKLTYNIRGWLTGKSSDKFRMKLRYQNPTDQNPTDRNAACYNGNICEWEWEQEGIWKGRMYGFTYDALDRLISSSYYERNGGSWSSMNDYAEKNITYDRNGNLKTLTRTGSAGVRNLVYGYDGNRLTNLSGDGVRSYSYDPNGNLKNDSYRARNFTYNFLNLLSSVNSGAVAYRWLADGTKLGVSSDGGGYDYLGSLTYRKTNAGVRLEGCNFPDGRILAAGNGGDVTYFLRDHLGSVRSIVNGRTGAVMEQNDYYPFGTRHERSDYPVSTNRYGYNGKEVQTTGDLGYLDYGARMYDPELGRWFGMDPLAEEYDAVSPYAYCVNEPLKFIDPDGRKVKVVNNVQGAMNNLAQIIATDLGRDVVGRLINSSTTYNLEGVFLTKNTNYYSPSHTIQYVANPWSQEVPRDGGALTSMTAMGHEMMHAYDHDRGEFNSRNATGKAYYLEPRAVSFANYLRETHNLLPFRNRYGRNDKDMYQYAAGGLEKIKDLKLLDRGKDDTSFGYRYTHMQGRRSGKMFGEIDWNSSVFYILINLNGDNNVNFNIYNNAKDYQKALWGM